MWRTFDPVSTALLGFLPHQLGDQHIFLHVPQVHLLWGTEQQTHMRFVMGIVNGVCVWVWMDARHKSDGTNAAGYTNRAATNDVKDTSEGSRHATL